MAEINDTTIVLEENIIEKDCECYESCEDIKFKDIVGSKTVPSGGYFGDLLAVVRANIEDSKQKGELTEGAAGEVYAQALVAAMKESVMYELSHGKAQKEIANIIAQTKYQHHKIALELKQYDLDEYIQKGKLSLERAMNEAQIRKIDQDIRVMVAQIEKINADIVNIDWQNKQIEQGIIQSKHEVLKIDASIRKTEQDIRHSEQQVKQIEANIINISHQNDKIKQDIVASKTDVLKTEATIRNIDQETIKSRHQVKAIDVEVLLTYQKIKQSISDIQKNSAAINQMRCQCSNETIATQSKIELNSAQIEKLICDCENSTKLIATQSALYEEQAKGFRDNARQKLFETQVQSYAMVFEAAEVDGTQLPSFLKNAGLNDSFDKISGRVFS